MKKKIDIKLIKESLDNSQTYSEEEKSKMLESLKEFNKLSDSIYRTSDLKNVGEVVKQICDFVISDRLTEVDEWFDQITLKRHMKAIGELSSEFNKTVKDIIILQHRLEASYEDIANTVSRYYEFNNDVERDEELSISIDTEDVVKEMSEIRNSIMNRRR
jgi:replicative DNA helicase